MSLVRRRIIPFPLEHMSQMPPTLGTHNLRPLHPKRAIGMALHRARHRVKKRRPSTPRLELVRRRVQGRVARGAGVGARGGCVRVVGAREGRFRALLADDAELFCGAERN
jgi:hypothetical protein